MKWEPLFNCRFTKNGGLTFFRLGRFQFSWCVCSQAGTEKVFASTWSVPRILDLNDRNVRLYLGV